MEALPNARCLPSIYPEWPQIRAIQRFDGPEACVQLAANKMPCHKNLCLRLRPKVSDNAPLLEEFPPNILLGYPTSPREGLLETLAEGEQIAC